MQQVQDRTVRAIEEDYVCLTRCTIGGETRVKAVLSQPRCRVIAKALSPVSDSIDRYGSRCRHLPRGSRSFTDGRQGWTLRGQQLLSLLEAPIAGCAGVLAGETLARPRARDINESTPRFEKFFSPSRDGEG
jgi:hypothetical protein